MSVVAAVSGAGLARRVGARSTYRRVASIICLSLIIIAGVAALALAQGINRQLDDASATFDIGRQARDLSIAISDAENGQRGFVITGDSAYLGPYRRASALIDTRLISLLASTKDDPILSLRSKSIADDIAAKLTEMDEAVRLVEAGQVDEARALIAVGMEASTMDGARQTLEAFVIDGNAQLAERNRALGEYRRWLVGAIVIALAGAAALTYVLLTRSQQEVDNLSERRRLLESENLTLEALVQERTQAAEEARAHAEHERQRVEALLRDTNHRIGNSLATVSSLLALQELRTKSDEVREALEAARSRVHAIASAHRRLRLGDDLETASAADFLDAVIEDIAQTAGGGRPISLTGEIAPIVVSARDATTLGILVAELATNALKHAFPDNRSGSVVVRLRQGEDGVPELSVSDDGIGFVPSEHDSQDGPSGLGSIIVRQLAQQFGGEPTHSENPQGGLLVTIRLPGLVPPTPLTAQE